MGTPADKNTTTYQHTVRVSVDVTYESKIPLDVPTLEEKTKERMEQQLFNLRGAPAPGSLPGTILRTDVYRCTTIQPVNQVPVSSLPPVSPKLPVLYGPGVYLGAYGPDGAPTITTEAADLLEAWFKDMTCKKVKELEARVPSIEDCLPGLDAGCK